MKARFEVSEIIPEDMGSDGEPEIRKAFPVRVGDKTIHLTGEAIIHLATASEILERIRKGHPEIFDMYAGD